MQKAEKIATVILIALISAGIGISYYNKVKTQGILSQDEQKAIGAAQNIIAGNKVININIASRYSLTKLPGIGLTLAQRIIDYRRKNGLFNSPDELMNVKGIGTKKYKSIKEFIVVDDTSRDS